MGGRRARPRGVPAIRARAESRSGVGPGGAVRARHDGKAAGRLRLDGGRYGAEQTRAAPGVLEANGRSVVASRPGTRHRKRLHVHRRQRWSGHWWNADGGVVARRVRGWGLWGVPWVGSRVGGRETTQEHNRRGKTGFTVRLLSD